ncbi:MAG: hypothetical protein IPP04_02705 [Saprospiraceae bacterium]|nr:hypothetical protein [Saprospiraceae bacterium]
MKKKKRLFIIAAVILAVPLLLLLSIILFAGAGRKIGKPLPKGNIEIPVCRSIHYNSTSQIQKEIIKTWSEGEVSDWVDGEKPDLKNPRTVLGCLLSGKRVEEINQYLLKQNAVGTAGSRWLLNPKGGYNFTTMALTPVLYLFDAKPELLYPATKKHLVENILTIEGSGFKRNVPGLPMEDTENHILMAESSRYLKNQWRWENGNKSPEFDNKNNGVEAGLYDYLKEVYTFGMYEFNAGPYLGYSYSALLNLNAFARGGIKEMATKILDLINWQYALNSYQFKHFPPYRRRFKKDFRKEIVSDYHSVMLMVWAGFYNDSLKIDLSRGEHMALWPSMLPYRPSDKIMEWTLNKPNPYFVKIGHGYNSCPEICSGDKSYLLSAGGANQGRRSLIMPKPTVLFLDDDAENLKEIFHMYGPGEDFMDWNNTGVYEDFACSRGTVHIPEGKLAVLTSEEWQYFSISEGIFLAVFSKKELGLMVIARGNSAEEVARAIQQNNDDKNLLKKQFKHPNGNLIEYDLDSPKDTWVIKMVNYKPVQRLFDTWPFFEGNIEEVLK